MFESQMSDKKFAMIFFSTIGLLFLLTLLLIFIAHINSSEVSARLDAERQEGIDQVVADRVEPVGTLNVGEPEQVASTQSPSADAGAADDTPGGEAVYQQACLACHDAGVAGAPKIGDQETWSERISKGEETLYDHAINGFQGEAGVMPAKGGQTQLSDDAVRNAVDYMLGTVGHTTDRAAETESAAAGDAVASDTGTTDAAASDTGTTDAAGSDAAAADSASSDTASSDADSSDAGGADTGAGEAVYQQACVVCHKTGVAGAPMLGDQAAWSERIAKGEETLYDNAINGYQGEGGVMPPKGGQMQLSDDDVRAAVDFMLGTVQ